MSSHTMGAALLVTFLSLGAVASAADSRFSQTHSRSNYVHWIDLYDANNRKIDPSDPEAAPYSPVTTCGRCHDYEAMSHGYHFNAMAADVYSGRNGEPWIWTDARTGTQIPLSYRAWDGVYDPQQLGITPREFVMKFGRQMPGGGPGEPPEAVDEPASEEAPVEEQTETDEANEESEEEAVADRSHLHGPLSIDCLICHGNDPGYDRESRWEQIEEENFAWAPTVAATMGSVEGSVSRLPDDFDPETAEEGSRYKLPATAYNTLRTNGEGKVFVDVIRTPDNSACYYCHSTRLTGEKAGPEWTHDEDVHLRAGMKCTDCHRNGVQHHTVRGFEGEDNPAGESVASLSCRGCHLGDGHGAGRLGAPKPLHKGLPPLHLDRLSCTACHSGPKVTDSEFHVQTAMAHGLGLDLHHASDTAPGIVEPVMLRDEESVNAHKTLYPHRMVWPAFWGVMQGDEIQPLHPEKAYDALRKTLRVRRGDTFADAMLDVDLEDEDIIAVLGEERAEVKEEEWTGEEQAKMAELQLTKGMEAFKEKMAAALVDLQELIPEGTGEPVFVSGGRAYRLGDESGVVEFDNAAARPYAWKLSHNVRPARWSLGVKGCYECHAAGTPIFEGSVTAVSQAPDESPKTTAQYELAGFDKLKLDAWNQSFQGRKMFKYMGYSAMGLLALILLSFAVRGINAVFGALWRS